MPFDKPSTFYRIIDIADDNGSTVKAPTYNNQKDAEDHVKKKGDIKKVYIVEHVKCKTGEIIKSKNIYKSKIDMGYYELNESYVSKWKYMNNRWCRVNPQHYY